MSEQLSTLLGAYYHEDYEGLWETFDLYKTDASPHELEQLASEIDRFLTKTPSHALIDEISRLGSRVWLSESPEPYAEWLAEIARRARA